MTGRIEMFEIPTWLNEELMEIANKGVRSYMLSAFSAPFGNNENGK